LFAKKPFSFKRKGLKFSSKAVSRVLYC